MQWLRLIVSKNGYFDPKLFAFMALAILAVLFIVTKLAGAVSPILELP